MKLCAFWEILIIINSENLIAVILGKWDKRPTLTHQAFFDVYVTNKLKHFIAFISWADILNQNIITWKSHFLNNIPEKVSFCLTFIWYSENRLM